MIIFNLRQLTFLLLNSISDDKILTQIVFVADPIIYMIGPIILYYFKSIIEKKLIIDFKFLLFCIPSLLIAINLWPYYQFSFPEKLKMVMAVKNHAYVRDFPMRQTLFFSFGTQKFLLFSRMLDLSPMLFSSYSKPIEPTTSRLKIWNWFIQWSA